MHSMEAYRGSRNVTPFIIDGVNVSASRPRPLLFLPSKKYPGSVLSHQLASNVLLPLGRNATWQSAGIAGGLLTL